MMNSTNPGDETTAQIDLYLKQVRIIFLALCAGLLAFAGVAVSRVQSGDGGLQPDLVTTLLIVSSLLLPGAIIGGGIVSRRQIAAAGEAESVQEKLNLYRVGSIIRWATIEGGAFFEVIAYMLTGNTAFLIILVALLMLLMLDRPSGDRLRRELRLL